LSEVVLKIYILVVLIREIMYEQHNFD